MSRKCKERTSGHTSSLLAAARTRGASSETAFSSSCGIKSPCQLCGDSSANEHAIFFQFAAFREDGRGRGRGGIHVNNFFFSPSPVNRHSTVFVAQLRNFAGYLGMLPAISVLTHDLN